MEEGRHKSARLGAAENTATVLLGGQLYATTFCAQRNTLYQSDWILDGPRTWYLLPKKNRISRVSNSQLPGPLSRFIT